MGIPPECQSIQDQIGLAQSRVQQTLEQLEGAAPADRATVFQQLKSLTTNLHNLQDSLGNCIVNSQQVQGLFGGTVTIVILNQQGTGTFACSTLLDSARTKIALTSFPANSFSVAGMTVTVTKTSGGSGSYASGRIVLPLGLHFAPSSGAGADLSLTLTTDSPGSPVTPEPLGAVTLVGRGTLQGGILNGQSCNLTIAGRIFPAA